MSNVLISSHAVYASLNSPELTGVFLAGKNDSHLEGENDHQKSESYFLGR